MTKVRALKGEINRVDRKINKKILKMGKRVYNLPIAKTGAWCYNETNPIPKGTQETAVMNHKLFASEYYFYFSFAFYFFGKAFSAFTANKKALSCAV